MERVRPDTGRTDVGLTEHGRHDATTVGDRLRAQRFDRVWTSPLSRAADTGAVAGFGDVAEPMDDLVEWDYGSTRGSCGDEILADTPGWQVWAHGAPGGESVEAVQARVDGVVARLLTAPGLR